jgi:hypothetical protein
LLRECCGFDEWYIFGTEPTPFGSICHANVFETAIAPPNVFQFINFGGFQWNCGGHFKRHESGYNDLISRLSNHEKDRHVLAAAIRAGVQAIVTFNPQDFPPEALEPYDIEATLPTSF